MLRYSPQPVTRCNPLFWPSCAVLWYAHGVILYSRRGIAIFVIKYIQPATGVNVLSCWGLTNGERLEMFIFWLILIFAAVFLCSVFRRYFSASTGEILAMFAAWSCGLSIVPFYGTPQRLNLQPSGNSGRNVRNTTKKQNKKIFGNTHAPTLRGLLGRPPPPQDRAKWKEHNRNTTKHG